MSANSKCVSAMMYPISRIEYNYRAQFLKMKLSCSSQCASLILLMLYLFLYNAEIDILRREVYANVRSIILKHVFITRSFVFITRSFVFITMSGNSFTIYYCIASVMRTIFRRF